MRVRYQYEEIIESTVREFCDTALAGERLPEEAEYQIHEQPMLDASCYAIWCCIEMGRGDVCLSFDIHKNSRFAPDTLELPAPSVEDLEGRWTRVDDQGEETTFVWTPETGRWILQTE